MGEMGTQCLLRVWDSKGRPENFDLRAEGQCGEYINLKEALIRIKKLMHSEIKVQVPPTYNSMIIMTIPYGKEELLDRMHLVPNQGMFTKFSILFQYINEYRVSEGQRVYTGWDVGDYHIYIDTETKADGTRDYLIFFVLK